MSAKTCINGATTMPYSLEEDIAAAAGAGFNGVEIWFPKLLTYLEKNSVKDLKHLIEGYGLQVATLCPLFIPTFSQDAQRREAISRAADLAREFSCPTLLLCAEASPEGMGKEEALQRTTEEARKCCEAVTGTGLKLAIEPLGMHPVIPGPAEALTVIKGVDHPALGLMMDTFHYYKSNVSLQEIAQLPIEKLFIVHVNDCEDRPLFELKDAHRLYPTLGVIPASEMIAAVLERGYDGYLSVEIFREEYWQKPSQEINEQSKAYLDKLLDQVQQRGLVS